MSVTILQTTPISGQYPEKHFGKHFTRKTWVEFEANDGDKWIGCFAGEYQGLETVLADKDNQTAFIVAGGQGYLVSIVTKQLLAEMDSLPLIESAIATRNPDYFMIGTAHDIKVFDKERLVREITHSDRTIDGIFLKEQRGDKAIGELNSYAYDGYKLAFDIDLATFEMDVKDELVIKQFGPVTSIRVQPVGQPKPAGLFERLFKSKK